MTKTKIGLACVIGGIVVGWLLSSLSGGSLFGGVYSQVTQEFREGLRAGTSNQFVVQNDGDLVTSGTIDLTASTFCIDFFATSTATAGRIVASSTATIEGTDGVMVYQYGACP